MIDRIMNRGAEIAIIVSHRFREPGVHFFTDPSLSQQLGYMNHTAGTRIRPHIHEIVRREVQYTQEVLLIRRGRLRVDFYDDVQGYLESRVVEAGDTLVLISGGHGFLVLEDVEMIEVKQGPFKGDGDKREIPAVAEVNVKVLRS